MVDLTPISEMKDTIAAWKVLEASLKVVCTKGQGFSKNPLGPVLPYATWHPFMNNFLAKIGGGDDGALYMTSERIREMSDFAAQSVAQEIELSMIEDEPELVTDPVEMSKILAADLLKLADHCRQIFAMAGPLADVGTIATIAAVGKIIEHWHIEFLSMTMAPLK